MITSGSVSWDATPGDPLTGDLIARELATYVDLLHDDYARRVAADTEAACAALLTTLT